MNQHLVIIGAGPAGEAAAKKVRQLSPDSQITLVEKDQPGGLCLNKGCIPSKTLLEQVRHAADKGQPIDWAVLQETKKNVVTSIRTALENTLKREKITLRQGIARFQDKNTIQIDNNGQKETLSFDKAIITTGTEILYPSPLDTFKDQILNSDRVLELTETPKSIVIVGGGAIGLEFACLLNAAGSTVTVVELTNSLLPGEDPNIVAALTRSFEARGIVIKTGVKIDQLEKTSAGWKAVLSNGETCETSHLMACVGRRPNASALEPEKAGITVEKNRFSINNQLQTSNPNVYAAGDAATTRLAHSAAAQARVAAANALGAKEIFDDSLTPRCLYSWPEVASVGQWKYQLEEKNAPVKATRAFYKGAAKALAAGETEGFIQIVSDPNSKKILGAQIIGAHATELIHIFSVALKAQMTTEDLGSIMFAHPTLAELVGEAAKK